MHIPLPSAKRKARIEIIPLIDIVFFLLATFVMVSLSMVKNHGIPVNLPRAATASAQDRENFAAVSVTESGELYLNKVKVDISQLRTRLRDLKAQEPDLRVMIQGDEKAGFGAAVQVLDEVRKLGIQKVSIQTKGQNS